MDAIKLENFARSHSTSFPTVRSLSRAECLHQQNALCRAFAIEVASDDAGLIVLKTMESLSEQVDANPCDPSFDLAELFLSLKIEAEDKIMINWDRFMTIDEIKSSDLQRFFSDIWYPSTDDIEIFDRSGQWFVMVQHWCAIRFARAHTNVSSMHKS